MRSRTLTTMAFANLLGVLGDAGWIGYWLFFPFVPFVTEFPAGLPILNGGKVVHAGERIVYHGGGTHYTDGVIVDVTAQLLNDVVIPLPDRRYTTVLGRFSAINSFYEVPLYAPAGKYRLVLDAIFHVNPLRSITYRVITEEFTVVAAEVKP